MKIALLVSDCGDGSTTICFFRDVQLAEKVANDDRWCEEFGTNEGSVTIIDVVDDFNPPFGWEEVNYEGLYD